MAVDAADRPGVLRVVLVLALLATGVLSATPADAAVDTTRCPPPGLDRAERLNWVNAHRDGYFAGADLTASAGLPDGRTVWLMGDTFIGGANGTGGIPSNTFLVEHEDGCVDHVMGWNGEAWLGVVPSTLDHFYWPRDAVHDGDRLHAVFTRYRRDGSAWLGGVPDAMVRARIDPATWTVEELVEVPGGPELGLGSSFVRLDGWTYVYGPGFTSGPRRAALVVARFPTGAIDAPWTFWDGDGWSDDAEAVEPVLDHVQNGASIDVVDGRVVAVVQEGIFTDVTLARYEAASPTGPFQRVRTIARIPDHEPTGAAPDAGFVYIGASRPVGSDLLVGWSYNTFDTPLSAWGDARYYGSRWAIIPSGAQEIDLSGPGADPPDPYTVPPPTPASGFDDVPDDRYYSPAVSWLADRGITTGIGGTANFAPDAPVTRGEMATFLWRYAGQPGTDRGNLFWDVPDTAFYNQPVAWLADQGITTGIGGTANFAPDAPVIRGEMATFLWRYAHR